MSAIPKDTNAVRDASDFWSRRRAAVQAEETAVRRAEEIAETQAQEARLEAKTDDELLAEAGLPDPDRLETPEAVRDFLQAQLPQRLRNRALRQLWRLNPTLANLDGLVDYGEDFTDSATVIEGLQTTYQVGKGMLAALQADEPAAVEPPIDELPAEELPADEPEYLAEAPAEMPSAMPDPAAASQEGPASDELAGMPQRRMRFHFEEEA